jgi:hypothetical protein
LPRFRQAPAHSAPGEAGLQAAVRSTSSRRHSDLQLRHSCETPEPLIPEPRTISFGVSVDPQKGHRNRTSLMVDLRHRVLIEHGTTTITTGRVESPKSSGVQSRCHCEVKRLLPPHPPSAGPPCARSPLTDVSHSLPGSGGGIRPTRPSSHGCTDCGPAGPEPRLSKVPGLPQCWRLGSPAGTTGRRSPTMWPCERSCTE